MRLSLVLLAVAAVGFTAGGWLVGWWMLGLALMIESACLAAYALIREVPEPARPGLHSLPDVLEKYREQA